MSDGRALIVQGDALHLPLPDGSVDLAVEPRPQRLPLDQAVRIPVDALGRIGIGVDLSHPYCRAARWRVRYGGDKAVSRTNLERQGSLL